MRKIRLLLLFHIRYWNEKLQEKNIHLTMMEYRIDWFVILFVHSI